MAYHGGQSVSENRAPARITWILLTIVSGIFWLPILVLNSGPQEKQQVSEPLDHQVHYNIRECQRILDNIRACEI